MEDKKLSQSFDGNELERFQDILEKARDKGLEKIETSLISAENEMYVFKARVYFRNGQYFEGHGDATKTNVEFAKLHILRVAETRAIARALRWKVGGTTVEEETK